MKATRTPLALAAWLAIAAGPAAAQVYGSLANFDAVNDTGYTAHGFEIEIEDASYSRSKLASIFGLDRDFGVPPQSVVRYGAPQIIDVAGFGVRIRYAASFAGGLWSTGTPTGPYPNAGDSCWTLGNPAYASGSLTCDHFGVGTYGTPAKVNYHWLVDPTNSGTLTTVQAAIPAVNFIYQPPAPGNAAPVPVVAEIEARKEDNEVFGDAFWVKVFAKRLDHRVELQNLMQGHEDVPGDAEVETEWEIFQAGDESGKKQANLALLPGDQAVVLRYEFYRYIGALGADGEALCSGKDFPGKGGPGPADCGGLGAYVGAQMAGFNAVQPPLPAVPEPATWALWLAGLGLLGRQARRRR